MTEFDFLDQNMPFNDIYFEKNDLIFLLEPDPDPEPEPFVYERRVTNSEYIKRILNQKLRIKKQIKVKEEPEKEIHKKKKGFISQLLYKFSLYFFG
jgi:hypothetical protein